MFHTTCTVCILSVAAYQAMPRQSGNEQHGLHDVPSRIPERSLAAGECLEHNLPAAGCTLLGIETSEVALLLTFHELLVVRRDVCQSLTNPAASSLPSGDVICLLDRNVT